MVQSRPHGQEQLTNTRWTPYIYVLCYGDGACVLVFCLFMFCWAFVLCFWMHKKQRESGRAGGKGKNMIKMYRMKNLTNKSVINKVHGHTKKTM